MAVRLACSLPGSTPCDLAVDSMNVYWTNGSSFWPGIESRQDDGSVMKAPLAGGPPTVLAGGQTGPCTIGVIGADVYWAAADALMKVGINGGPPTRVLALRNGRSVVALDTRGAWILGEHGAISHEQGTASVNAISLHRGVSLNASNIDWLVGGRNDTRVIRGRPF